MKFLVSWTVQIAGFPWEAFVIIWQTAKKWKKACEMYKAEKGVTADVIYCHLFYIFLSTWYVCATLYFYFILYVLLGKKIGKIKIYFIKYQEKFFLSFFFIIDGKIIFYLFFIKKITIFTVFVLRNF